MPGAFLTPSRVLSPSQLMGGHLETVYTSSLPSLCHYSLAIHGVCCFWLWVLSWPAIKRSFIKKIAHPRLLLLSRSVASPSFLLYNFMCMVVMCVLQLTFWSPTLSALPNLLNTGPYVNPSRRHEQLYRSIQCTHNVYRPWPNLICSK